MLSETSLEKSLKVNIYPSADTLSIFGVWLFILSDCILFSVLLVTYVVLQHNTVGGPGIKDIVSIPYAYLQSLALLASNYFVGKMIISYRKQNFLHILICSIFISILGIIFLSFQWHEFSTILNFGFSWKTSAFLSAYFSLVGIFMLHLAIGIIWLGLNLLQMLMGAPQKFVETRFVSFILYWHFLSLIWCMIFIIVYLMGAI